MGQEACGRDRVGGSEVGGCARGRLGDAKTPARGVGSGYRSSSEGKRAVRSATEETTEQEKDNSTDSEEPAGAHVVELAVDLGDVSI